MPKIQTINVREKRYELLKDLYAFKSEIQQRAIATPFDRNVFLMMKYRSSNKKLSDFIVDVLKAHNLNAVRADMDEWNLTMDNVINPLAVLYCCKYGIALFDEPEEGQNFSPNVAYELGIMHYQHKSCLILINKAIASKKPFDLVSKIHSVYNEQLDVKDHIDEWVRKNNINVIPKDANLDKVAIAIVKKGNKFLLTKRKIKEGKLQWAFPAKKLRPDARKEKEAIENECFGETNIKIKATKFIGSRVYNNNGQMELRYWLCEYIEGKIDNKDTDELDEIRWVTGRQAIDLISSEIYIAVKNILLNKKS